MSCWRACVRACGALPAGDAVVEIGDLRIELDKRAVYKDGQLLSLTPNEFKLLRLFSLNVGRLLTHAQILREVWGPNPASPTTCTCTSRSSVARSRPTPRDRATS